MRLPIAVGMAALMFLTTGCKEGQEAAGMLPHLSDDQAKEIVAAYAEEALRISGLAGYSRSALSPSPCRAAAASTPLRSTRSRACTSSSFPVPSSNG